MIINKKKLNIKRAAFYLFVLTGFIGFSVFANGGYFGEGSVAQGHLYLMDSAQIQIVDEKLDINLRRGFADVTVVYKMKNTGDSINAKFGFPSLVFNEEEIKKQEILRYSIEENKKPLKAVFTKGKEKVTWFKVPTNYMGYEGTELDLHPFLNWYFSNLQFKKNEEKTIRIQYMANYQNLGFFVSSDTKGSQSVFHYLLSFGATWKGPIKKGKVVIHAQSVDPDRVNIEPSGRFKKDGRDFVWNFSGLEPTGKDNLVVRLGNAYEYYPAYSADDNGRDYFVLGNQYYKEFSYQITSSSFLKEGKIAHGPQALNDKKMDTAWVEGVKGDGIGEFLVIKPRQKTRLTHIAIASGFNYSRSLYEENNRLAGVEVIINGTYKKQFSLPDEFTTYEAYDPYGYTLLDVSDFKGEVNNIKLVISKVYKGSKYDDTCVSEILLLEKMNSKPQIQMSR